LQTKRLAKSFEGLNSSLAQSTGEFMKLQSGTKIAAQYVLSKYKSLIHWQQRCQARYSWKEWTHKTTHCWAYLKIQYSQFISILLHP